MFVALLRNSSVFVFQFEVSVNLVHAKMVAHVTMWVQGTSAHALLVSKEAHVKVRKNVVTTPRSLPAKLRQTLITQHEASLLKSLHSCKRFDDTIVTPRDFYPNDCGLNIALDLC